MSLLSLLLQMASNEVDSKHSGTRSITIFGVSACDEFVKPPIGGTFSAKLPIKLPGGS